MNIALFGYAGNPPHLGHLEVIEWLAARYDKVLVSPSASHAFGKKLPDINIRVILSVALLSCTDAPNVELIEIEEEMAQHTDGPIYSYDVLCELRKQYPNDTIHLAVGPDNAVPEIWQRFHRADDIMRDFGRVIAPDMGAHKRSTQIRAMLERGASYEELCEVTTPDVAKLIGMMPELYGPAKVN